MLRRGHLLTENKSTYRPEGHIFVDVETHVETGTKDLAAHRFRLGHALYWRRRDGSGSDTLIWHRIEDPLSFWRWVSSYARSKSRLLVISHHLDYDMLVLQAFRHLPALGWDLCHFFLEPGCKLLVWRKGNYNLTMLDNANWFKGSLADWGERGGLPKLDVDPLKASDEELEPYCRRDVEILYRLWRWWYRFLDHHDCGAWGITLPSQAFHAFRHRFLTLPVWIHAQEEVLQLEREAYHGGRCECFRQGFFTDDLFYKLDINSMYPYMMWGWRVPLALEGYQPHGTVDLLRYRLERHAVIARVALDVDVPYYPVSVESGVCYPVGKFVTVLTTPELKLALDRKWILDVMEHSWYRQGLLFRDYVRYWYTIKDRCRKREDWLQYAIVKGFLNYLYGKFGQKRSSIERLGDCDPEAFSIMQLFNSKEQRWSSIYQIAGGVFQRTQEGESYNSFPAIAAHVTATARMYLYSLVEHVGRWRVLYCDTDSLILDSSGFREFAPYLKPYQLGHFKIEAVARAVRINAPKDYSLDGHVTLKGIRRGAHWIAPDTVEQEIFPSIKGHLKAGISDTYYTMTQIKRLERVIRSGVRGDFGRIDPLEVDLL